jgi:hypothetical protein
MPALVALVMTTNPPSMVEFTATFARVPRHCKESVIQRGQFYSHVGSVWIENVVPGTDNNPSLNADGAAESMFSSVLAGCGRGGWSAWPRSTLRRKPQRGFCPDPSSCLSVPFLGFPLARCDRGLGRRGGHRPRSIPVRLEKGLWLTPGGWLRTMRAPCGGAGSARPVVGAGGVWVWKGSSAG